MFYVSPVSFFFTLFEMTQLIIWPYICIIICAFGSELNNLNLKQLHISLICKINSLGPRRELCSTLHETFHKLDEHPPILTNCFLSFR